MSEAETEPLATVQELKQAASEQATDSSKLQGAFSKSFIIQSADKQEKYTHLMGLQDHYKHKARWSHFLMVVMLFMIVFQSFLLAMVGLNQWNFTQYNWLLPALLVQNLAQIIGLAVFVVKALFRDLR